MRNFFEENLTSGNAIITRKQKLTSHYALLLQASAKLQWTCLGKNVETAV